MYTVLSFLWIELVNSTAVSFLLPSRVNWMIVCAFVTKEQHKILSQNRKTLSGKQSLQRNRAYRRAAQASWAARNRIREMWCVGCHVLCITVFVCVSVLCSEGAGDRIDTVTALFSFCCCSILIQPSHVYKYRASLHQFALTWRKVYVFPFYLKQKLIFLSLFRSTNFLLLVLLRSNSY